MRIYFLFLILLIPTLSAGQTVIPDNVMPFGVCGATYVVDDTNYSSNNLRIMHDSLGFNIFVGKGFNAEEADLFSAAGIYPYPEGILWDNGWQIEAQQKFSHSTYFVTQPEEATRNVRFLNRNGERDGDYWIWKGNGVMLGGLKLKQYCKNGWLYSPPDFWGDYYVSIQAKRDNTSLPDSTVIGVFNVINNSGKDKVFIDSIRAADLPAGQDIYLELYNDQYDIDYYRLTYDNCRTGSTYPMEFELQTFDACSLYIDSVLIHCQIGDKLIAGEYDSLIVESVDSSRYENKIAGYFLKDSIRPGSYAPAGYIDGLIRNSTADWTNPVRGYAWVCALCGDYDAFLTGYRDYVDIAHPHQLWAYLYPTEEHTVYDGFDMNSPDYWQSNLQKLIAGPCDSIRAALDDSDSSNAWFFTPQTWFCQPDSGCIGSEKRRRPTASEVLCETFLGLCYHPSGIIYYQYESEAPNRNQGLIDASGQKRTDLYNAIKDDINPYIKAIDSTYLSLTWDTAYTVNYEYNFRTDGTWIDTIYAVSDNPNPDLGWFHVGQFTEGDDKYVMIVNRACSRGPNDPEPAPPVTATIEFKTMNLRMGNYVNIIDLAKTVHRDSSGEWIGIPDTTRADSILGSVTYSTEFGPGEGRLFKIERAR